MEDGAAVDVGYGIAFHHFVAGCHTFAVAAAEHIADGVATIDVDVGGIHAGFVAAAVDEADAVVAVVDGDARRTSLGCLVTAAEHVAEGIGGT